MSIVVMKFGGSSVGNEENFFSPENMPKLAQIVKLEQTRGHKVVVVISAMSGVTRKLKAFCETLNPGMNAADSDVVLTSGEQITAGLMSGLLNGSGVKAKSMLAWQIPFVTDNVFGGAQVKNVSAEKILDLIGKGIVPVIAGYQGVTDNDECTTLGFDGSDTTAVAVAGALKASKCVFYKDVRALYSSNPRRVPKACRINEISFEEMSIFAELGSRILHPNSVKLAQKYDVPLQVRPTFDDNDEGSIIDGKTSGREIIGLTYFQQSPQNITISLVGKTVQKSDSQKMIKILNSEKIFAEEIILLEGKMNASVTIGWVEQLERALVKLHQEFGLDAEGEQQAFVGIGKQVFDPAVK